jgi:hypothetical protein
MPKLFTVDLGGEFPFLLLILADSRKSAERKANQLIEEKYTGCKIVELKLDGTIDAF